VSQAVSLSVSQSVLSCIISSSSALVRQACVRVAACCGKVTLLSNVTESLLSTLISRSNLNWLQQQLNCRYGHSYLVSCVERARS
jgi:hypothetical protein